LLSKLSERPEQGSALVQFLAVAERINDVDVLLSSLEQRMANGEKNIRFHLCNAYNAAILACGVLGELEQAMGYLQRMKDNDVQRNEATYRALLNIAMHQAEDEHTAEIQRLAAEEHIFVL
jgi:pentatricopeptide repeat protein